MMWQHAFKATSAECNLINLDAWLHWQPKYRQQATEPNLQDGIVIVQFSNMYKIELQLTVMTWAWTCLRKQHILLNNY